MTTKLERAQILNFRVAGHHLDRRLPSGGLLDATAGCGIRSKPSDTALLALSARVESVTHRDVDRALDEKSLVEVMSARGTAAVVPASDVHVFTLGTLPGDEQSLRDVLKPFVPVLDHAKVTASEALRLAAEVAHEALAERELTKGELSGVLTRRLPELSPMCRGRCGVAHVDDVLFRLVGVLGIWCCLPGADAKLVRTDRWLGEIPRGEGAARAELVRRYLGSHGPSTADELAAWAGISTADARRSLHELESELVEVVVDGKTRARALARDLDRLQSPPEPAGVRLLPPNDPYLMCRDRETLVPDRSARQRLWRPLANPGAVLVGAELVATWRTKKKGKRLEFTLEPIAKLPIRALDALQDEADGIALRRSCSVAEVVPSAS